MMRWVEEVEILEEDFRRLIRAAECMAAFWGSVTQSTETLGFWNSEEVGKGSTNTGYIVYAQHKADMYRQMASNARARFASVGGDWPREDETVAEYALRRRPDLSINWDDAERYLMNGGEDGL
jgi:hypothetical protein